MNDSIFNPIWVMALGWVLFAGTPLAGVVYYRYHGDRRDFLRKSWLFWVLSGSGPVLALLWLLFNLIEDALGLESVFGLLLNLIVLFPLLGAGLGLGARWAVRRVARSESASEPPSSE